MKTQKRKVRKKKSTKGLNARKGIAIVGTDPSAAKFHLTYPRIEIHGNVSGQEWYRYLSDTGLADLPFRAKHESLDATAIRNLFLEVLNYEDPEEFAKVPVFDLRREQAIFLEELRRKRTVQ